MKLTTRNLFRGTGQHRAAPEPTAPVPLLRPIEAVANELAPCPAEGRTTLHALNRDGSRTCWTCRTISPGESQ
ncbi:hypothetical protein ACVHNB_32670 [Streptomyces sp. YJ-C3]